MGCSWALKKGDCTFLERALGTYLDKLARFRMSLEAHKTPWKTIPIVCYTGTLMNCLSYWLDYPFQRLKHLVPTYIKDTRALLNMLNSLRPLPANAESTADTVSMYTSINTNHALQVIADWLDQHHEAGRLPSDFPLVAVKEAMEIVMKNKIFGWGDLYFLQLLGTANGHLCCLHVSNAIILRP
ncbi:hypothetical protein ACHAWF_007831 [Thalassiosira exigua]